MRRFWLIFLLLLTIPLYAEAATISSGGGHQIQDTGSNLTQRPKLNFSGTIACADNAGANSTDCEGGPATPSANYYVAGHMSPAELVNTDITTHWGTAKLGAYSLLLDGANDYATVKNIADVGPTSAWTLEAWIKHTYTPRSGEILLHMDGTDTSTTFTDSGTGAHTFTAAGNAQIDTAQSKWGGASGLFDGTGDSLSTPDHINFDYSGGIWTVSVQGRTSNISTSNTIFSQLTDDNNYIWAYVTTGGAVKLSIFSGGAEVLGTAGCVTGNSVITVNNWYHIEFVENGNNYYVYVNGIQQCHISDVSRPANYTGVLTIGNYTGGGVYWFGWLDEFRSIKGTAVHATNFNPPAAAYPYEYAPFAIIGKYDNSASKGGYSLEIDANGYLVGKHWSGVLSESCTGTTVISENVWHHVAATYDTTANELKCYLDGAQTGTTTTATGIDYSSTVPLIIGANGNSQANGYFLGYLDEVAIWNTALPASGAAIDILDRYNAGSGSELAGTESNLETVWHFNDGSGSIAIQPVDQTGVGSDSYDCTSATYVSGTTGPCKTIQHVVNIFPKYYANNSIINIASGVYPEIVTIEGLHPSGEFELTVKGYINSTGNQFSDVANSSGTSTGSNTAGFPTNSGSLFNNTGASFTTADNEQLLKITGGNSYCSASEDAYKNWYRIDQQVSATQLKVVTRWNTCGEPIRDPQITALSTMSGGGTLTSSTTYSYRVVATNANGITIPSAGRTQTSSTSGGDDEVITINWNAIVGATGYKIYGRTVGSELLMATWNGSSWDVGSGTATSWVDTGSVTPLGALPNDDSTQTLPNNTTTYQIFRDVDMSTINGGNVRDFGIYIKDSTGIVLEKLRARHAILSGFYVLDSSLNKVLTTVADSNYLTPYNGTYWTGGYQSIRSYIHLMRANRGTRNYFQNYHFTEATQLNEFSENLSSYSYSDAGIQFTQLTTVELVDTNLSSSDSWNGLDFEYGSVLYRFQYNRVFNTLSSPINGGGFGLAVATNSAVNFTRRNSFNSNTSHGILLYGQSKLEYNSVLIPDSSIIEVKDNGGYGIVAIKSAMCVLCSNWTNTGNTSGQYYYDYVFDYTNKRLGLGLGMVTDTTPDAELHIKAANAREYIESTGNSNYAATLYFTKGGSGTQRISGIYVQGNETAADGFISLSADNSTFQLNVMQDGKVHIGSNCTDPDAAFEIGGTGTGCNTGTGSYINAGSTAFTANSSREIKDGIKALKISNILNKISRVPVNTYYFKDDPAKTEKIGLIAEDFYSIFQKGNGKTIDGQEVDMAMWLSIQALISENRLLKGQIKYLCSIGGGCP